jgi:hypothetical protein
MEIRRGQASGIGKILFNMTKPGSTGSSANLALYKHGIRSIFLLLSSCVAPPACWLFVSTKTLPWGNHFETAESFRTGVQQWVRQTQKKFAQR